MDEQSTERYILGDLLKVITDHYEQSDRSKGVYPCSPESNEWRVGWNQPFSLNPHLLECQVIEYISRAPVVYKDLVSIIVPNTYAYYRCIVVWVVEMSCIFLCESNYEVVDTYHL